MLTTRRLTPMAALTPAFIILAASPALAQEIENDATAIAPVASLKLTEFTVLVLTSLLIPVLTGLLTKVSASATVKQIVTAGISTISGVITTSTQADNTALISFTTVQYALLSFAIATVGYLGIYKPHDSNARLAPNFGLGDNNYPE